MMLPIIEEVARVDKVEVDRGGYRIVKTVETSEERIDQLLADQTVEIERRPIGRQLTGMDAPPTRYEGDTIVIPVVEEILVTEKRLVLVEEVRITRIHGTRPMTRTVSLRKEKIEVERLAAELPPPGEFS